MKKWIFFILVLVSSLLEATLLDSFKVFGVKPNLLLVNVSLAALIFELKWAYGFGIFAGILKDSLVTHAVGINTLLFPLWIFLIIKLSKEIPLDNNLIRMALVSIAVILHNISTRLIFLALGNSVASVALFLWVTFLESLYTAAVLPLGLKIIKPLVYPAIIE